MVGAVGGWSLASEIGVNWEVGLNDRGGVVLRGDLVTQFM